MRTVREILRAATDWAAADPRIAALALVGSHARGTARPDSDVDLVVLTDSVAELLEDASWTDHFGRVTRRAVEEWGRVRSLRVGYEGGLEIEFALAPLAWAVQPLDPGTARVLREGCQVLFDRVGILSAAVES